MKIQNRYNFFVFPFIYLNKFLICDIIIIISFTRGFRLFESVF